MSFPKEDNKRRFYLDILKIIKQAKRENIKISLAKKDEDYRLGFSLIYEMYYNRKLITTSFEDFLKKNLTKLYNYPNKIMILVKRNKKVTATATLLIDNGPLYSLPCEFLYKNEVQYLRKNNKRITEVVRLASIDNLESLFRLFRFLYKSAFRLNCSDILCTITKKHFYFYKRFFFFENISKKVSFYDHVCFAPVKVILAKLDIFSARFKCFEKFPMEYYNFFFEDKFPEDNLFDSDIFHEIIHKQKNIFSSYPANISPYWSSQDFYPPCVFQASNREYLSIAKPRRASLM